MEAPMVEVLEVLVLLEVNAEEEVSVLVPLEFHVEEGEGSCLGGGYFCVVDGLAVRIGGVPDFCGELEEIVAC